MKSFVVALVFCGLTATVLPAQPPPPADLDLASVLGLGEYYVRPVSAKKDARTGFVVGGKNTTALIRELPSLNGRTIAALEADMRPGAKSDVGSGDGFLGADEKLLDVLAMDNKTVVEDLSLTHQELAKHLHAMGTIGFWQLKNKREKAEFVYRGRRFKVAMEVTKGTQPSPFRDGTDSGSNATVENLDTGKKIHYGLLLPHLIERYGFYEGKGTPWRLDPKEAVEVFDFLKPRAKKE